MNAETIRQYFNKHQSSYDRSWSHHHLHYGYWGEGINSLAQAQDHQNTLTLEALDPKRGGTYLDAGCGVGTLALRLAQEAQATTLGVTVSDLQVERARKRAVTLGLNSQFLREDFCHTSLPDASLDGLTAVEAVSHTEEKPQFIKEAFRLLKPGGRLVICDGMPRYPETELPSKVFEWVQKWKKGWALGHMLSPEEFSEHMQAQGFGHVHWKDHTDLIAPSSIIMYGRKHLSYPVVRTMHRWGLVSETLKDHLRSCALQKPLFERWLGHFILVADKPR